MERSISTFRKTDHFLRQQWFRNIEDSFLEKILPQIEYATDATDNRNALVVSQKCLNQLKKQGIDVPEIGKRQHLVIIWKTRLLITVFVSKDENDYELLRRLKGCRTLIC